MSNTSSHKQAEVWANRIVFALHMLVAPFVVLREYTITQDGPSHLYGAHIIGSLRHDPVSPYLRFFAPNLRPIGNSLFSYLAVGLERVLTPEHIGGLTMLGAIWALPLCALAFNAALRRAAPPAEKSVLPRVAAWSLACPLAYNYFLYRGFFNYTLGVPLSMLCLSAVLASGTIGSSRFAQALYSAAAAVLALLSSLAHPSANVFLLAAIPLACVSAPRHRKVLGALLVGLLVAFFSWTPITGNEFEPVRFSSPIAATWMFVRALGVTHSLLEVLFAVPLLALAGWGAFRVVYRFRCIMSNWTTLWPGVLALALTVAYFFIPFQFRGPAGLNERIPLFVVLLLLPYIPLTIVWQHWFMAAFAAFCLYTTLESFPRNRLARQAREASAAALIPRGSLVYTVSLQSKLGSLSADLGLHLLADIGRRYDLVMPEVFCYHPAHVLRCLRSMPEPFNASAVLKFEHLTGVEQQQALADPRSALRKSFDRVVVSVGQAEYLMVLRATALDDAFSEHVLTQLGAIQLGKSDESIGVYRLPKED